LRSQKHGFQIDGDEVVPISFRDRVNRLRPGDAGVVDQDLDRAKAVLDGADKSRHLLGYRHVGLHDDGAATEGFDFALNVSRVGVALVEVDGDVDTLAGERDRGRAADPPARAGHQGDFVGQLVGTHRPE